MRLGTLATNLLMVPSHYLFPEKISALLFLIFISQFLSPNCASAASLNIASSNPKFQNLQPIRAAFASMPLIFEPNQGQTDPAVLFKSRNRGFTLFLTSSEAVFVFKGSSQKIKPLSKSSKALSRRHLPQSGTSTIEAEKVLRMKWNGAQAGVAGIGLDKLPGHSNYFIGNDSSKWIRDIEQYGKTKLKGIYPGIDLTYYDRGGKLEFDWDVNPGAQPEQIQLELEGMQSLNVEANGDIKVEIEQGKNLILKAPEAYQENLGHKEIIGTSYKLLGQNLISLQLAPYDKGKKLVIDPVLMYSTYLGYAGTNDGGSSIAVDSSGNAYITGSAADSTFPTFNAFQPVGGGQADAIIVKIDSSGALVYSTLLGGGASGPYNGADGGSGIAVDSSGNAYVVGTTQSPNFPLVNPLQAAYGGGTDNAFVSKLNASGNALIYSTYLGGSTSDGGSGIAVDSSGNAYIVGTTYSADFPLASPFQASCGGCPTKSHVFVSKLNASGSALVYSTYLGGSFYDNGSAIAVDSSGNAYITGETESTDFPLAIPLQASLSFGPDAFVTKLNSSGSALVYSTFLGGGDSDGGDGIAVDSNGNAYVTGYTWSNNFPTFNPLQTCNACPGSGFNAFVSKINATGTAFVYSTYLGGSGPGDEGLGITADINGNAYITGYTTSSDFPVTNSIQPSLTGFENAFVTKINSNGNAFVYSTYLGGSTVFATPGSADQGSGIAVDSSGNAFITGETNATDFPLVNPIQAIGGGYFDVFISEISAFNPTPTYTVTPTITNTFTPTLSPTATPTVLGSPTNTPTVTPSATPTKIPTPSLSGPPKILSVLPVPNPLITSQGKLGVQLQGNADSFEVKVYSTGYTLMDDIQFNLVAGPGWTYLPLDTSGWSNGLVYIVVSAQGQGKSSKAIAKFFVLR